jgi:L-2,4-diaminobutyric acid acetyltransferase
MSPLEERAASASRELRRGTHEPAAVPAEPVLRPATVEDGAAVWRLVRDSGVLDVNSSYAYLLFLDHFGHTSLVAEAGEDGVVGFVTGFRPPLRPEVVVVWQVAVAESMRGRGLARRLLDALVRLDGCRGVRYLETTVTPSNAPSQALFRSFARALGAELTVSPYLGEELFPDGEHEEEERHRIGPFVAGTGA